MPELLITDLAASLNFWVTLSAVSRFSTTGRRRVSRIFTPARRTSCSSRSESVGIGSLALSRSRGHLAAGVNFQVAVLAIMPLVERLSSFGWPLFMAPEDKWYQTGDAEAGVSQFLVQGPIHTGRGSSLAPTVWWQ